MGSFISPTVKRKSMIPPTFFFLTSYIPRIKENQTQWKWKLTSLEKYLFQFHFHQNFPICNLLPWVDSYKENEVHSTEMTSLCIWKNCIFPCNRFKWFINPHTVHWLIVSKPLKIVYTWINRQNPKTSFWTSKTVDEIMGRESNRIA